MPYVSPAARESFTNIQIKLRRTKIRNAGELQYVIALIIKEFLSQSDNRYQSLNDVMGALAGAQQEFYRRVVVPFEDSKIDQNGDVY